MKIDIKNIFIFVLLLFLFYGCDKNNKTITIQDKKSDTLNEKKDIIFKFEKIIFHSTQCFGICPVCDLEIKNDKFVKLSSKIFIERMKIDSSRSGNFFGTLSDSLLLQLSNMLQECGIDTLTFSSQEAYDLPTITIIVYYNGKRKFLQSMFPPESANKLIRFLHDICEKNNFHKTEAILDIEGTPRYQN